MVEPSSNNTGLNAIIGEIFKLLSISAFNPLKSTINQIATTVTSMNPALGSKSTYLLEPPTRYLQQFIGKYNTELKNNPDISIALCIETLETVQQYLDSLAKMTEIAPEKKTQSVEQVKSGQPVSQPVQSGCTIATSGLKSLVQKSYTCETCNITGRGMVCQGCATTCHAGHKLIYKGELSGYCDCRFETTICKLQEACTFKHSGPNFIAQQKFACQTCNMNPSKGQMMCQYCALTCHKGHTIAYAGTTKGGYCDCKSMFSFCSLNKNP